MLEDIYEGSQYHLSFNRIYAHYQIRDHIKQRKFKYKGWLKSTRNMGKVVHKVFKAVVKEISKDLPIFGESGSEVSYFIPEPRNFSDVTRLSDDINKPWLKATLK